MQNGGNVEAGTAEWGSRPFTPDVEARIGNALKSDIPHVLLAERQGPGRGKVNYIEHHVCMEGPARVGSSLVFGRCF
jgi:hypothetical protein